MSAQESAQSAETAQVVEALLHDLDAEIQERRAAAKTIGRDDRQAWIHFTAGLSEARDRLRQALVNPPEGSH